MSESGDTRNENCEYHHDYYNRCDIALKLCHANNLALLLLPLARFFLTQVSANDTNQSRKMGSISDVMKGADVFVGVSGPDLITAADIRSMAKNPIAFATVRSRYPNQVSNVLAFPRTFRSALDSNATFITENMKLAPIVTATEPWRKLVTLEAAHKPA